jgi:Guanine nucleotide exchange factor in Golgi transport N-terminal
MLLVNELESITLPDGTTQALGPAARDAFAIFEDLCLLGDGEHPQFLQLDYLHKTFALELIESVLTNYHEHFRKVRLPSPRLSGTCCQQLTSNHSHVQSIPSS